MSLRIFFRVYSPSQSFMTRWSSTIISSYLKIAVLDKFVDVNNRVICISIVDHESFQNAMYKVKI